MVFVMHYLAQWVVVNTQIHNDHKGCTQTQRRFLCAQNPAISNCLKKPSKGIQSGK